MKGIIRLSNANISTYPPLHTFYIYSIYTTSKVWWQLWPFHRGPQIQTVLKTHTNTHIHTHQHIQPISHVLFLSPSLCLTALLEHACIIHLATSRMWGLVKNWTHHSGEQKEVGSSGGGWEGEGEEKKEWQREGKMKSCFIWWAKFCGSLSLTLQWCTRSGSTSYFCFLENKHLSR